MKTKACLFIVAGLVIFLLGGFVMTQMVEAQYQEDSRRPWPTNKIVWDYDSGWVETSTANYLSFNHALGGDHHEYFVYITGKNNNGYGIHQRDYGRSLGNNGTNQTYLGLYWSNLTSSEILIWRGQQDDVWGFVRVRILKNQ